MDRPTLQALGLTASQADAYIALVQYGSLTPNELAAHTSESRTNAYKLLDKLVSLGLAHKEARGAKQAYRVANPAALESRAKQLRDSALEQEKRVKDAMPALLNFFYTYSEQPGVRFFQGKAGIRQIFEDMLRTRQTIYLLRSPADISFYDDAFFNTFKRKRAQLGIETIALTPDVTSAVHDPATDTANRFNRTWLPANAYTANVEWDIYGNKVALISYGEEAIGTIIESPQIAASFKQVFQLLRAAQGDAATVASN